MGKRASDNEEVSVEMWDDEEDSAPRKQGWFRRRKAHARAAWRDYVDTSIPADDDVDEGLPVFLRGHRGRIIFAVATMLLLFGWTLAIAAIVF